MTPQDLGGLANDRKKSGIFQAYGFSIPVGKDGRRMWPRKFKRQVVERILSGSLTESEVQKTCDVSRKTTDKWRREVQSSSARKRKIQTQKFFEVEVEPETKSSPKGTAVIELNWRTVELTVYADYPVELLVELIRQLGTSR